MNKSESKNYTLNVDRQTKYVNPNTNYHGNSILEKQQQVMTPVSDIKAFNDKIAK